MSRSLRGLSQEGVREALSRNPRLRWVTKTVLRPLIDRLLPQISAAQNENLLPKVEPILFHYMMVSLTATLSGFGPEMEVISNLSPGDSPESPKPIGVWLKGLCLANIRSFHVQKWISAKGVTPENGWAAELPKEPVGEIRN
jgi:hypothetical protein